MSVRNKVLGVGTVPQDVQQAVYVVPAGFNAILKSVILRGDSASGWTYAVRLSSALGGTYVELFSESTPQSTAIVFETWQCMNAGDELLVATAGHPLHFWVSGAELPNP